MGFTQQPKGIVISLVVYRIWKSHGNLNESKKLDDGWPESVEEQGLLLLVWRHHITKQYIKDVLYAVEKRSIKTI